MSKIINIEELNSKVVITFKSLGITLKTELTKRYCVWQKSRWDLEKLELERYFVEHGKRGCFLDAESYVPMSALKKIRYHTTPSNIQVWDLSLIFPNVNFIENDLTEDIMKEVLNDKYKPLAI